jgi:hypothetical protein
MAFLKENFDFFGHKMTFLKKTFGTSRDFLISELNFFFKFTPFQLKNFINSLPGDPPRFLTKLAYVSVVAFSGF